MTTAASPSPSTSLAGIRHLYDYAYWANERLMSVVLQLTVEEFVRDVAGSYGSIRNTLVHVLSAEWGWLDRCGGHPRGAKLDPANYGTPQALADEWARVEAHMRAFLAGLTDADLSRQVEFSFGGGPAHVSSVGHLLQHGAIHGVHHRGQAALLLRLLGHAPGNFDLLYFGT